MFSQGSPGSRPPQFHMGAHLGHDPLGESRMTEGGTEPSVCPWSVSMWVHTQSQELNSRDNGDALTPPQQVREVVLERGRMRAIQWLGNVLGSI